jgi:hypothetical protein
LSAICAAQCPASATGVFTGPGIDHAIAADGRRYTTLDNAFVYRERVVPSCTCNGKSPHGLVTVDIHADATLQRGDIVVMEKGPVAFTGSQRLPHRAADFTPIRDARQISETLRKQLSALRVTRQPATEIWAPDPLLTAPLPASSGIFMPTR